MKLRLVPSDASSAAAEASPDSGDAARQPPLEAPSTVDTGPFERATAAQRERAASRLAACDRSDALVDGGMKRARADLEAGKPLGASASSVGRWRALTRDLPRGERLARLLDAPGRGRPRYAWDDPGAEELWRLWCSDYEREGPDGDGVDGAGAWRRIEDVADENGWTMPPLKAFLRRHRREVPRGQRVRARTGVMGHLDTQPRQQRTVSHLALLDIVNGDGRGYDVRVEFPSGRVGRPVVWIWQDVRSRRLLSWIACETENADAVRITLHEIIVRYGAPGRVLVDNTRAASAKWLTGRQPGRKRWRSTTEELPGLLALLDIRYSSTGVTGDAGGRGQGHGWAKPVERAFLDLKGQVEAHPRLEGALTGRSPEARPETHRQRAAPWDDFVRTLDDAVHEYNARDGRRMEIADGRSIDAVWAAEWPRTVVRRLSARQAALLLLAAEDPVVDGAGTFGLKAGRAGALRNRYRAPELVDWSGRKIVARFDPRRLHEPVQVHDPEGRWICEAACHLPVAFDDAQAGKDLARLRRRERRAAETAIRERTDIAALRTRLDALPRGREPAMPDPAVVRLVTGEGLPELPHGGQGARPRRDAPAPAQRRSGALAEKIRFWKEEEET